MKFTLPPVWAALALAGGLAAAPPCLAVGSPAPPLVSAAPNAPSRLAATGRAFPIGSQIQLSWLPVPLSRSYRVYRDGKLLAPSLRASLVDYGVAAGETHSYVVTAVGGRGESRPCAPATATVPPGGGSVIYADALENGWSSWSWAAADLGSTATIRAGSAIRVTAGPWQALYLHHAPFSAAPYAAVTFWIHGGASGGQKLCVKALRSGVPQAAVALGPLPAGKWQSVSVPLRDLGVANAPDLDGLWVQNASGTAQLSWTLDEIALSAAPPAPVAPAAPGGLSATPQWAASCPKCGGMAMAHIVADWNAVPGASSYTVYRDGVKVQDGLLAPGWTDMSVSSGHTYAYAVTATGPGGESLLSSPASAVAPDPPSGAVQTAPVNLSVQGLWQGLPTDALTWSPVPGAAGYNVYEYSSLIARGVTATSYTVPTSLFYGNGGMTYTVTAVDAAGTESLPAAIVTAQGARDPDQPGWQLAAPPVPTAVVATPEWNAGSPRIHLTWQGFDCCDTYSVYRDGKKVASGLWGLNYYDQSVRPGESHTYAVSGVNLPWTTDVESLPSAPVTAVALSAALVASGVAVQVTDVKANDDSALVSFAAVPGALDYRVYNLVHPNTVKYSGGSLSIEMNGLDPAGADLVVEAVDKLGPFQTMDGMAGPGAMQMDGMHSSINGQGDPSDVPFVLAASAPLHVTSRPVTLAGSQVFFDTFRSENPLVEQPLPTPIAGTWYGTPGNYAVFSNDKWTIRNYQGDVKNTKIFFMGNHFMDTLYDGGTPGISTPTHNNNASLVLMPNATADLSGGKVLHVTFEVDMHNDGRRYCEVFVGEPGDTLTDPGKFADFPARRPTLSGRLFRWGIHTADHTLSVFPGVQPDAMTDEIHLTHQGSGVGPDSFGICARSGPWCAVPFNGTMADLDKRHKFDLYLSKNRAVIMEQGFVVKDAIFPAGVTLPFDQCQVYFVHQLYHTSNDRYESVDVGPAASYWYNHRPWADERHWDNMGQEVLGAFPAFPTP